MRILIIRHAEPDYEHNTLTEKGFREAAFLSDRLSGLPIDHIFSSPLNRAVQTATPTAEKLGIRMDIRGWLQEFRGKILDEEGKERIPWNLLPRKWEKQRELYDVHTWLKDSFMLSGDVLEAYHEVEEGFLQLLGEFGYQKDETVFKCSENIDQTIAIFCHFGVGMLLISILSNISPVLLWQSMFLPTSSVSTFVTEERIKGEVVFKCLQLGDTSHLYAAGEPVSKSGLYRETVYDWGEGPQV